MAKEGASESFWNPLRSAGPGSSTGDDLRGDPEHLLRILMLEDVATDARLIEYELRQANIPFVSRCVESPSAFVNELQHFRPDIILSDFSLPQFDALHALRLLQENRLDLPFILVTGSQSEEVAVTCIKNGADDYILKSSLKRLPSAVLSVLQKKRTERERERAELLLRQNEEHFRALIDNASDIITVLDSDGTIRYESPSLERALGYRPDELLGKNAFDFIHPEDLSTVRKAFIQEVNSPGTAPVVEYRFRHKNGSWRVLETIGKNLLTDPQVVGIVANSRDVTERKLAEERIRQQAALLDKAHDAIMVVDMQFRITFWNKSAERLYGWTAQEAGGQRVDELLEVKDQQLFFHARTNVIGQGEWHGELNQVTKSNAEIVVESSWTLVADSDGKPKSILIINSDVTNKKKLEEQFLRIQRMESIGTLAGGIAHDLNNVLTPVTVAIRMLRGEVREGPGSEILDTLEATVHRGACIVQQVLSFARGVEGERTLIQIKHPLTEVLTIAKETFPKSIYLSSKVQKDLWPVEGDPTQLHQVFMNLFVNARDAMPHGGRVHVEAQNVFVDENYARMQPEARVGRYIRITLSDNGTGIPPELMSKVFEPFFTTKEVGKGTGLGLSTALGIIKSHSGFLTVQSEVSKGTRFEIYLPAADGSEPALSAYEPVELPRGLGEIILVADDEFAIRDILRITLENNGYRTITVSDGPEAVAMYAQYRSEVHAVIVDAMMPFMDGSATIRAIQRLNPEARFIAVSGLMDHEKAAALSESAATICYIAKPFTAEELLLALDRLLHPRTASGSPAGE